MSMTENKKPLAKVQCQHPALFKTMCVSCGKIIKQETGTLGQKTTSLLTLHGGTALQVSNQEAESIQAKKISSLREQKKIALVLDLDHTLLHAIQIDGATPVLNEKGQKVGEKEDIYHLPIEEVVNGFTKHLILKKRPHLDFFLKECHEFCQMTIYTAGTRRYAEAVAKIIDPTRKYFSNRIVSRTDNPNVKNDGHDKSLERIFLSDSSMVVIIDDREDVWKNSNANSADANQLLLARPFIHFNAYNMKNVTGGGGGVIVEANHASGPTGATGQSTAVTATTAAAVAPITPVIALAGQYPGKIIKTVSQGSNEYSDADDQLIRCLEITKEIHRRYYDGITNSVDTNSDANTGGGGGGSSHFLKNITDKITSRNTSTSTSISTTDNNSSNSKPPVHPGKSLSVSTGAACGGVSKRVNNVATILSEMKMTVLAGCTVTFSGIIPTNETAPQKHLLYKLAVSLGATVSLELLPRTTHLISVNINTEKANEAIQKRSHNIWILHPDWLIYCRWALARVYEVTFMLNSMTPGTPFPVPEMNYQPLTPTVSKRPSRKTADSTAVSTGGSGRKVFALDNMSTAVTNTTEGMAKPPLHQQSHQQQAEKRGREEEGDENLSSANPSSLSLTVPPQDPRRQKRLRITAPGDNVSSSVSGGRQQDRGSPLIVDLSCLEAGEILENDSSAVPRTSDTLVSCDSVTSLMEFPTPRPSQAMLYFEPSTPPGGPGAGSSDLDEILGDSEDEGDDDDGYKNNNNNKNKAKLDSTTSLATADTLDSSATRDSNTDDSNPNNSNNNGYNNEYIIDNEDEDVYGGSSGDDGNSDDDEDDANMRCCDEGIFRNGDYGDDNGDEEDCDTPNTALDNNTLGQDNSDGIWWHDEGGDDDDDEFEILDRKPASRTAVSCSSNVPALLRKTPPTASPKRPSTAAGRVKQLMSEVVQSGDANRNTSHSNSSSSKSSNSNRSSSSDSGSSVENSGSQDQAKNKSEVEGEVPMEYERVESGNEEGDKEDGASDSDDFSDFESIILARKG